MLDRYLCFMCFKDGNHALHEFLDSRIFETFIEVNNKFLDRCLVMVEGS